MLLTAGRKVYWETTIDVLVFSNWTQETTVTRWHVQVNPYQSLIKPPVSSFLFFPPGSGGLLFSLLCCHDNSLEVTALLTRGDNKTTHTHTQAANLHNQSIQLLHLVLGRCSEFDWKLEGLWNFGTHSWHNAFRDAKKYCTQIRDLIKKKPTKTFTSTNMAQFYKSIIV